jgi:hypothetical protein
LLTQASRQTAILPPAGSNGLFVPADASRRKSGMIKVIENMIPDHLAEQIETTLLGWQFGWYHYANTNYADNSTRGDDTPQFVHGFIRENQPNSEFASIPLAVLRAIKMPTDQIIRAKANLMVREPKPVINPKHTDDNQPHVVLVYYVNDSDGDTHIWLENGTVKTISPKRGRGVLFAGHLLHSSRAPVENRSRMVLNFNLKPDCVEF